jgi:putative component of membrane protein insertase Oxa1/YidC/SpoIIIJ protein YidD
MRWFILVLSLLYVSVSFSQGDKTINEKILNISFDNIAVHKTGKGKLFSFKKKRSYFNPLNYLGAGILYVYQNIFSEQIQANCTYEVSCSEYTRLCIQKFGFFTGTLKGFNQLSECTPNTIYEHSPAYINSDGKIINHFEKETK